MTVHCDGDCRLIEQVGEKQDFECELSRRRLPHEDFKLRVLRRSEPNGGGAAWNHDYSVAVTYLAAKLTHVYTGGPRRNWVGQFANDLLNDAYRISRTALRPSAIDGNAIQVAATRVVRHRASALRNVCNSR